MANNTNHGYITKDKNVFNFVMFGKIKKMKFKQVNDQRLINLESWYITDDKNMFLF